MNQVNLTAQVVEAKPVRYTPAGLPVLDLVLQHESSVTQANQSRQVGFNINAVAIGDTAHLLSDLSLGSLLEIKGFLAPSRKGSSRLVLHIQSAGRINIESTTVV